jgi:hypothetical protein
LGTAALLVSVTRPVIVARKSCAATATVDADTHSRLIASAKNRWNFLFTISSFAAGGYGKGCRVNTLLNVKRLPEFRRMTLLR